MQKSLHQLQRAVQIGREFRPGARCGLQFNSYQNIMPSALSCIVSNMTCGPHYLFTPWRTVLLEKLTGFQLVKKLPAFYGTRRFITTFTISQNLSLFLASSIQSITPHFISCISILILSSHLHLCIPNGLFSSGFPTISLYTTLFSNLHATCPAYLILVTRKIFGEQYRSLSSTLCSFLHSPVTFLS